MVGSKDNWHVYNQKNRDKVRRDEAAAEDIEHRRAQESLAADREHQLSVLRERAKRRMLNNVDSDSFNSITDRSLEPTNGQRPTSEDIKAQHVNFWSDVEQKERKSHKGNEDYEAEEKAKKIKFERQAGVYLDTGNKGRQPWLLTAAAPSKNDQRKKERDQEFTKVREDPLNTIKSLLDQRDKSRATKRESSTSSSQHSDRKKLRKESGADMAHKELKERDMSTIERLRKERFEREQSEKTRALTALDPTYVDPKDRHQTFGAYSQQFNPEATSRAHSSSHSSISSNSRGQDRYSSSSRGHRRAEHDSRSSHDRHGRSRPY
ncbi:hypothetical protein EDD11_004794 [Mortierella claussenii]|nr:hypothetical protein EDD11_004794 [Mortierella claussenii]